MKSSSVTIQMKATEQCFPVVLFMVLWIVFLTIESVNEILKCDHSNKGSEQWCCWFLRTIHSKTKFGNSSLF